MNRQKDFSFSPSCTQSPVPGRSPENKQQRLLMSAARPGSGDPQGAIAGHCQRREGDAEGFSGQGQPPPPPPEAEEKAGASLAAEVKPRRPSEDEAEGAALLGAGEANEAALGDDDQSPGFSPSSWWRRLRQRRLLASWPSPPPPPPLGTQCCPCAPARSIAHCCHGGAKMAALAYTLGKREINHYFSVRSAKALALGAVLLLAACHAASRRYQGEDGAAGSVGASRGKEGPPGASRASGMP